MEEIRINIDVSCYELILTIIRLSTTIPNIFDIIGLKDGDIELIQKETGQKWRIWKSDRGYLYLDDYACPKQFIGSQGCGV
jgi:hypothetical protein